MTGGSEHPASGQLALFALCGDLVIAIEARAILEIRRTAETVTRAMPRGLAALELEAGLVPGWDLGELLGFGTQAAAWVVVELAALRIRLAFRVGRCILVEPIPPCRAIPHGIFAEAGRPGAIAAGFSLAGMPALAEHVSGVVVDVSRVLTARELASSLALDKEAHEALDA